MSSLYKISEKLQEIFEELEEQGGEFTEEQLKELEITEEELKEKVDNYVKVIKEFKNSAEFCKKEKDNIYQRQKMFTNRVDKLKNILLEAVSKFGKEGKTNKFIETDSCKVYTKNTKSCQIDETRMNLFKKYAINAIGELMMAKKLPEEIITDNEILEHINARYKECTPVDSPDYKEFTINDLYGVKFKFTISENIPTLSVEFRNALYYIINYYDSEICNIEIDSDKTSLKSKIESGRDITVAEVINKESLIIK